MLSLLLGLLAGTHTILVLVAEVSKEAFPAGLQVEGVKVAGELACGALPGQRVSRRGEKAWVKMALLGPWNHSLRVMDLDVSSTRNDTCWAGPFLLSSTFQPVQDLTLPLFRRKEGRTVAELSCVAESYDGTFTCSWETLYAATFQVCVCRRGQASAACLSRGVAAPPGPVRLSFRDCSFCPFAELHDGPLQVKLEGVGEDGMSEELTTEIFLPNIVRPPAPDHLVARRGSRGLVLRWTPPASWPLPSAYFSLRYHLRLQLFGKDVFKEIWSDKLQESREEGEEELIRRVQIRCRDPILHSAWSPWSAWAPVHGGRPGASSQPPLESAAPRT